MNETKDDVPTVLNLLPWSREHEIGWPKRLYAAWGYHVGEYYVYGSFLGFGLAVAYWPRLPFKGDAAWFDFFVGVPDGRVIFGDIFRW